MVVRILPAVGFIVAAHVACQGESHNLDRVGFFFSEEERRVYETHLREESRTDFSLSIRIGVGEELLPARAHFRGHTTFSCERRNYTLNLNGMRPRNALEGSVTDEFFLLSLCFDDRYVRQHTVLQIWKQLGLFPFEFRYVELTIDGESRGVYLLVEKLDRLRIAEETSTSSTRRQAPGRRCPLTGCFYGVRRSFPAPTFTRARTNVDGAVMGMRSPAFAIRASGEVAPPLCLGSRPFNV